MHSLSTMSEFANGSNILEYGARTHSGTNDLDRLTKEEILKPSRLFENDSSLLSSLKDDHHALHTT